jgi:hypothetical protein
MCLKWSASIRIRAVGRGARLLRASSSSAASKKARRLATPVRWSQNAERRRWAMPSRLSLMSRRTMQYAGSSSWPAPLSLSLSQSRSGSGEIIALAQNSLPSARRRGPSSRLQPFASASRRRSCTCSAVVASSG